MKKYDIEKVKITAGSTDSIGEDSLNVASENTAILDENDRRILASIPKIKDEVKRRRNKRKFVEFSDINHYEDPDSYEYRNDMIIKNVKPKIAVENSLPDMFKTSLFNDGFRPRTPGEKKKIASLMDDLIKSTSSMSTRGTISILQAELSKLHQAQNPSDILTNFDDLVDHMDEHEELDVNFPTLMNKQEVFFRCIQSAYFNRVKEKMEIGSVINAWFQYVKNLFPNFVVSGVNYLSASQYIPVLIGTDSSVALIMTLLFSLTNLTYSQIIKMKCSCCGSSLMNVVPFGHCKSSVYNVLWNTCSYLSKGLCFQHYVGMTRKTYSAIPESIIKTFSPSEKIVIESPIVMHFNSLGKFEEKECAREESDCDMPGDILPISIISDAAFLDAPMTYFDIVDDGVAPYKEKHLRAANAWVDEAANLGYRFAPIVSLIKRTKIKYSPPVFDLKDVYKMMAYMDENRVDPILLGMYSVANNLSVTHACYHKCKSCHQGLYETRGFFTTSKHVLKRSLIYKQYFSDSSCMSCLISLMNSKAEIGDFAYKLNDFLGHATLNTKTKINKFKLFFKEIIWDILLDDEKTRYISYLLEDDKVSESDDFFWDADSAICSTLYMINSNIKISKLKADSCTVCSKSIFDSIVGRDSSAIPKFYKHAESFRLIACLNCLRGFRNYQDKFLKSREYERLSMELFRESIKRKEVQKHGYKVKIEHAESFDVP